MKKAGLVTAAIILLAVGGILLYRYQSGGTPNRMEEGRGTLVYISTPVETLPSKGV